MANTTTPKITAMALWDLSVPMNDTPAHDYLNDRMVSIDEKHWPEFDTKTVRYLPASREMATPSMVAAIRDLAGSLLAVQLIPLQAKRAKIIGMPGTGAVQLKIPKPGETLLLVESVADGLCACCWERDPVWAILDYHRLGNVELPSCLSGIRLWLNNAGFKAIEPAVAKFESRGLHVDREIIR